MLLLLPNNIYDVFIKIYVLNLISFHFIFINNILYSPYIFWDTNGTTWSLCDTVQAIMNMKGDHIKSLIPDYVAYRIHFYVIPFRHFYFKMMNMHSLLKQPEKTKRLCGNPIIFSLREYINKMFIVENVNQLLHMWSHL